MNKNMKKALTIGASLSLVFTGFSLQESHASVGSTVGGALGGIGGAALGGLYDLGNLSQNNSVAAVGAVIGATVGAKVGNQTQSLPSNVYHGIINGLKSWVASMF
jgi:outer membrane lipoprotein SlyB